MRRAGDRVGLVLFGSEPYVQAPLSFDRQAVARMADEVLIGVARDGTTLGDAVALSDQTQVLELLTDGSSTSGVMSISEALILARAHQVSIYTIGTGVANARPGEGLDEEVLRLIASATGGRYFHARNPSGLEQIYAQLDTLESLAESASHHLALYHWPLSPALALALCAFARNSHRSSAKILSAKMFRPPVDE